MRRMLLICIAFLLLTISVSAAPPQQQEAAQGTAEITSFTTTANGVSRDDLANRTARVPVSWTTANRPLTSNLVFEQVLPGGGTVNVELPRLLPWVVSNGQGVAAPILPGGNASEIVLRARLINLFSNEVLSERQLTLPIVSGGSSGSVGDRASITSFTSSTTYVNQDRLDDGTARIPVSWATANRPATANLVFEQVLSDGSTENVELPRENPFVLSSGNGLVAPVAPGDNATSVVLRVSLFDLINGRVYDLREITVPVLPAGATPTATPAPAADIRTFTLDADSLNANELANGSARVIVRWSVVNRPANSNLVFEQILANGTVVNVELPRSNPIVASEGQGLIAPRAPGGAATTARFALTLVGLNNNTVYDRAEVTLPVVTPPTPTPSPTVTAGSYNLTFSTTVNNVQRQALVDGTARMPVSWSISPRPNNSNLYFEQVLPDGTVRNVELPRSNPMVASSGNGIVAPTLPYDATANQIVVRVRLADSSNNTVALAQRELIIPVTGSVVVITPIPRSLFDVSVAANTVIESSQITNGVVIVPITWNVSPRPDNTNLVFEQILPSGAAVNAELPRPNPIVPSSGVGAVSLRDPGAGVAEVRVRVRLYELTSSATIDSRQLTIPISGRGGAVTSAVTATAQTPEAQSAEPTACPIGWFVQGAQGCPTDAPQQLALSIQQFEQGLMLYRSDSNQVYFLTNTGTVIVGQPGAADGIATPPEGLQAPSATFQAVWSANQERAGWATTPEGSYLATIQSSAAELYLTLPDGRTARLIPASSPSTWAAAG